MDTDYKLILHCRLVFENFISSSYAVFTPSFLSLYPPFTDSTFMLKSFHNSGNDGRVVSVPLEEQYLMLCITSLLKILLGIWLQKL